MAEDESIARLAQIQDKTESLVTDMTDKVEKMTLEITAKYNTLAHEATRMVQSLGQDFTSESVNVIKSVRSELAVAKHRRSDLEVEKTRFDMEKEQSKALTASQESKIRLQVGEHFYTTLRETLCRVKGSMLEAMFSGRHVIKTEADGLVFIDRDGEHFKISLNYLRDGKNS